MIERKNLLDPLVMQDIVETESKTEEKTLTKILEIVTQAIRGKEKDNIRWFCYFSMYFSEKGKVIEQIIEIAIGPVLTDTVPLIKKKIEKSCNGKIQTYNFGEGNQLFFVERIESSADIFLVDLAIRRKLNEPGGEEAIRKEIEEAVEKIENAFKTFNGILNRIIL